jgi:hypothetical protein
VDEALTMILGSFGGWKWADSVAAREPFGE